MEHQHFRVDLLDKGCDTRDCELFVQRMLERSNGDSTLGCKIRRGLICMSGATKIEIGQSKGRVRFLDSKGRGSAAALLLRVCDDGVGRGVSLEVLDDFTTTSAREKAL